MFEYEKKNAIEDALHAKRISLKLVAESLWLSLALQLVVQQSERETILLTKPFQPFTIILWHRFSNRKTTVKPLHYLNE